MYTNSIDTIFILYFYYQSRAEETIWKRWATCWCISCVVAFRGKGWKRTRWKNDIRRSGIRSGTHRSRFFAMGIPKKWLRICDMCVDWISSRRPTTNTWGISSTICTRNGVLSTMKNSTGLARRWYVIHWCSMPSDPSICHFLFYLFAMHARKEDRIIEELHDGWFCPETKHVSQESISKKPINKVIFFLPFFLSFCFWYSNDSHLQLTQCTII